MLSDWVRVASNDPDVVRGWWQQFPDANVGIATGRASVVVVLDIDPRHGGEETLRELERTYHALPPSIAVTTGSGGRHIWFAYPEAEIHNSAGKIGKGLDIRGEGGLVVVPPSLHVEGRYSWAFPTDASLAGVPDWLVALSLAAKPTSSASDTAIAAGERNSTMLRFAGSMRRAGFAAREIGAALHTMNEHRCDPPLDETEVDRIVASSAGWAVGAPWLRARATVETLEWINAWPVEPPTDTRHLIRLVGLVIGAHANDACVGYPSYTTIERLSGVSRRYIRSALDWLEETEVLSISKGRGNRNVYTLTLPERRTRMME